MFPANLNYPAFRREPRFGEIESLLDQFFRRPAASESFFLKRGEGFPPITLAEDEHGFSLEMEIPGVPLENIDISLAGSELTISGKRAQTSANLRAYHRQERFSGEFTRVLKLGTEIDAAKIKASLKDGVLTVSLPKGEAAKPRRIEVKTN